MDGWSARIRKDGIHKKYSSFSIIVLEIKLVEADFDNNESIKLNRTQILILISTATCKVKTEDGATFAGLV